MKIVHCMFSMQTGGAEILTVALANKMCEDNDVSIIIVNNVWETEVINQFDKRIKLYFLERDEGSRNPIPVFNLNILLYRLNPDIIHCHEPKMGRIIKVRTAKVVYTIHDIGIPIDHYNHYDLLVAISDAVYQDVAFKCPYPLITVYNGIAVENFKRRNHYSIQDSDPIRLIQVSRLVHEKKGQDILILALAKIKEEYNFDIRLDLVGSGSSLAYLQGLVKNLHLEHQVNFLGEKNSEWLHNNLSDYHLLVQPSRYEGFGLTILEGFAAGLPVLASDIDGPAEIINKLSSGFLFKNGDVIDCANEIRRIIKLYKEGLIEKHTAAEKDMAEIGYSISACADSLLSTYRMLKDTKETLTS